MAAGAAAAAAPAAEAPASGAGNPFQLCSNLYAEKNNVGATVGLTTTAGGSTVGGGQINAGQYLRALRMILRTSTAGTVATPGAVSDLPWNILLPRSTWSTWTDPRSCIRWADTRITSPRSTGGRGSATRHPGRMRPCHRCWCRSSPSR